MADFEDVIDSGNIEVREKFYHTTMPIDRFLHMIIDFGIVTVLSFIISNIIKLKLSIPRTDPVLPYLNYIWLGIYSGFYFGLEFFANATVGKLVRRTRVLSDGNAKPKAWQVFLRLITRLIPFGFIMILTKYEVCLHDFLSKTWVMKKIRPQDVGVTRFRKQLKPRNFRK